MIRVNERNQDATLYVGGLDDQCSEAILWELFTQAGPVVNVHMPKDRITGNHQGYGFVEFSSEEDADYAMKVMNMVKLYGKPLRANKASANQKNQDIGANIFIGNLDPEIDEKVLYDTFSSFGNILQAPKIMRDFGTNISRCYAFINYASFEASDAAIESMNGQYFSNRQISVTYAFKKDGKGERHGTIVERLLAQKNKMLQAEKISTIKGDSCPSLPPASMMPPGARPPLITQTSTSGLVPQSHCGPPTLLPSQPVPAMTQLPGLAPMAVLNPLASMNPMPPINFLLAPPPPPSPPPPPTPPPPDDAMN